MFVLKNTAKGTEREFDNRAKAQEEKENMRALGAPEDALEIVPKGESDTDEDDEPPAVGEDGKPEKTSATHPEEFGYEDDENPESDDTDAEKGEVFAPESISDAQEAKPVEGVPDEPPALDEDPISWAPEHFVDKISGTPAINRKGYAVMAERFGIEVVAEPITLPSETDFEYAEFRAIAECEDGREYSGFGSAHVHRDDGDDPQLLGELAETRSMKRALAYATGVGMTAVSELKGSLE